MVLGGWTRLWLIISALLGWGILTNDRAAERPRAVITVRLPNAGWLGMSRAMQTPAVRAAADQCSNGKAHGEIINTWNPPSGPLNDYYANWTALHHQPQPGDFGAVQVTCDDPPGFDWVSGLWNAAIPGLVLGGIFGAIGWVRRGFRSAKASRSAGAR